MAELQQIATGPGLVFDVMVDGPAGGPLVLMLHGASESFHMWRAQLPALAAAGFRALAPSQRGYSAGARPTTADVASWIDALLAEYAERQNARVKAIAAYARGVACRHRTIAAHFGERLARCGSVCDICAPTTDHRPPTDDRRPTTDQ